MQGTIAVKRHSSVRETNLYVLDFLGRRKESKYLEEVVSEIRLLCSGELYNGKVQTCDWRKSYITRILLKQPFLLQVVSQPFDDFPQELALALAVEQVTETSDNAVLTLRPDQEIAQDIASLLTVFLRRLITVFVKVREFYSVDPTRPPDLNPQGLDLPFPIANGGTNYSWKRKPVSIVSSIRGIEKVIDNNPPPLGVDPGLLNNKLEALPKLSCGEQFVRASRLYAQAMQIMEGSPEMAYQLLINSAESLANSVFADFKPDRTELIKIQSPVAERAKKYGLTEDLADELAVLASSKTPWSKRKFQLFLETYSDESIWAPDDLFKIPDTLIPSRKDLHRILGNIYNARSAGVHEGKTFEASVGIGSGSAVSVHAIHDLISGTPRIPPLVWFEKLVNTALNRYIERMGAS
jgi:hypothetical protein